MFFRESREADYQEKMAAAVRGHLGEPHWPPSGYAGARRDQALAEALADLLVDAREDGLAHFPFMPFVDPPELDSSEEGEAAADDLSAEHEPLEGSGLTGPIAEGEPLVSLNGRTFEEGVECVRGAFQRPVHLFLRTSPEAVVEAIGRRGHEWWCDFWQPREWQSRRRAGQVIASELSDVYRYEVPVGRSEWAMVYYQGTSRSGATVGLMTARWLRSPRS